MIGALVCYSFALAVALRLFLNDTILSQPWLLSVLIILGTIAVALLAIVFAVVTSRAAITVVILAFVALILLLSRLGIGAIAGSALLAFCFLNARASLRQEIGNRIYYRTAPIFRSGSKMILIGFIVAGIGVIYPFLLEKVKDKQVTIRPIVIEPFFKPVEPFIAQIIPGYSSGQTINNLLESQLASSADNRIPDELRDQQRDVARQRLEQQLNQKLSGHETLPEVAARTASRQVTIFIQRYPLLSTLVLLVFLFFTFNILVPLLIWPVILVISAFVWLFIKVGLFHRVLTLVEVERLQLIR